MVIVDQYFIFIDYSFMEGCALSVFRGLDGILYLSMGYIGLILIFSFELIYGKVLERFIHSILTSC